MEIHYKITTWEKFTLNDDDIDQKEVIKLLEKEDLSGVTSTYDGEYESMYDCEEHMSLEDNAFATTVEVLVDGDDYGMKTIWKNGL